MTKIIGKGYKTQNHHRHRIMMRFQQGMQMPVPVYQMFITVPQVQILLGKNGLDNGEGLNI